MRTSSRIRRYPTILVLALLATGASIAGSQQPQVPGRIERPPLPQTYAVSGDVVIKDGSPAGGVEIVFGVVGGTSKTGVATTDARGHFLQQGLTYNPNGYLVIPQKSGFQFNPAKVVVTGPTTGLKFVMNK